MKYAIIGAGAMGSVLAGYMTLAEKDVTVIARGENLKVLQGQGLTLHTPSQQMDQEPPLRPEIPRGETLTIPVRAVAEADYDEKPDVVIISVKAYALDSIGALLDRICTEKTIVLPLLNSIGIAKRIEASMTTKARVIEGVAYVACELLSPGEARHKLDFFRIVIGMQPGEERIAELEEIAADFSDAGGTSQISDDMLKSELTKFVRIAALSGTLAYYGGTAGDAVASPERTDMLRALATEIRDLADAAGSPLDGDPVGEMVQMMKDVYPGYRSSLKADIDAGKPTEIREQIFDAIELGKPLGVEMPAHRRVAAKFGYEG